MCSMARSVKVAWSAMPAPYPPLGSSRNGLQRVILFQPLDKAVELDVVGAELPLLAVLLDGHCVPLTGFGHLDRGPPLLVDEGAQLREGRVVAPSSHGRGPYRSRSQRSRIAASVLMWSFRPFTMARSTVAPTSGKFTRTVPRTRCTVIPSAVDSKSYEPLHSSRLP